MSLTPDKISRERAVFASFIYDLVLLPLVLYVAVNSSSLTMLGEALRGVFLVSMAMLSWITLRRIHRGLTGGFDFGLGKVEQVLSLLVALALSASIAFIWYKSFTRVDTGPHEIGLMNFAAVGLTFLNLLANAAPLPPLYKALKFGKSVLVMTQFRAKVAKTIGSVIATVCVAVNQLVMDADVSLWADRAGMMVVTLVTLHAAYELMTTSIPDILDRTLSEDLQIRINWALARHYHDFDTLIWCRSRQSGSDIEVQIGLGFGPEMPFSRIADIVESVARDIEEAIPGSHVVVTPVRSDQQEQARDPS